jgi:hypothetical protein
MTVPFDRRLRPRFPAYLILENCEIITTTSPTLAVDVEDLYTAAAALALTAPDDAAPSVTGNGTATYATANGRGQPTFLGVLVSCDVPRDAASAEITVTLTLAKPGSLAADQETYTNTVSFRVLEKGRTARFILMFSDAVQSGEYYPVPAVVRHDGATPINATFVTAGGAATMVTNFYPLTNGSRYFNEFLDWLAESKKQK